MDNIADIAQLGFAAVMAVMLLATIRELLPRLLTIIEQNAAAMQRMAAALERVVATTENVDRRLLSLEEQHRKEGVR
jgi:hypothetical protein